MRIVNNTIITCLFLVAFSAALKASETSQQSRSYTTLKELVIDEGLRDGMVCNTSGYYRAFDGGAATYLISRNRPSSYSEEVTNGYYAMLLSDKHNIRCYGAVEGRDCSQSIQKAINSNIGGYIMIPEGHFKVDKPIVVKTGSLSLKGEGDASVLFIEKDIILFDYSNAATERLTIQNVCFEGKGKGAGVALYLGKEGLCLNSLIEHCVFRNFQGAICLNKEVDNITVRDCVFLFNVNGVYCDDISTNKSSIRIHGNHFQMQREKGVSVHIEVGSSVDVSDNLFQTSHRNNIVFMKLHSLNQVVVSNNYLELSGNPDKPNSVGIDLDYVNGVKIDHIRAQGYLRSVVRIYNSYWTEVDRIVYSPIGHTLPTIIENVPNQKAKLVILDMPEESVKSTTKKQMYIDNLEGVHITAPREVY